MSDNEELQERSAVSGFNIRNGEMAVRSTEGIHVRAVQYVRGSLTAKLA